MEHGFFSRTAALFKDAKRSRNEAPRCAGGAAAIALMAAIIGGTLALTAAVVPCSRLDPAAILREPVRTIDVTTDPTRQFMAL